ncbi:MAG: GntR family transcriptional regulator [Capsulimonadaceae bacterium]|nr:GntR family transcriptional regulator [Capsulimonadaceae bacterium]
MAQRKTTGERRRSLADSLRRAARDGSLPVGTMLPTVRELSAEYQLSVFAVSKELQVLVDEGILYTSPRVGTFVGQSLEHISRCFLLTTASAPFIPFIKLGFEERIAQLGASSLVLPVDEAVGNLHAGTLPELSGVFDFATSERSPVAWPSSDDVPLVRFADRDVVEPSDPHHHADRIYFDEAGGGRQATSYLQRLGHTRIAYVALHTSEDHAYYLWSAKRMHGWRDAMDRAGQDVSDLIFLPAEEPSDLYDETATAAKAARAMIGRADITAVVGANDNAIAGLIQALRESHVPESRWPAMVGFDNQAEVNRHVLTSLRLPWEDVGRAAAQLLWDRSSGQLTGPPEFVSIAMRMIARPGTNHGVLGSGRSAKALAVT